MLKELSYSEIWSGFVNLEAAILGLDYAMWLDVEYYGKPRTTKVCLTKTVHETADKLIAAYRSEHDDELSVHCQRCARCGCTVLPPSGRKTCGTVRDGKRCGGRLKEVRGLSERQLDEKAWSIVGLDHPILCMRTTIGHWLTRDIDARPTAVIDEVLPLREVLARLRSQMRRWRGRLAFLAPFLPGLLRIDHKQDLLPQGDTIGEYHADYLAVRDGLTSSFSVLTSTAMGHPEFREAKEQFERFSEFGSLISLPQELLRQRELTKRGRPSSSDELWQMTQDLKASRSGISDREIASAYNQHYGRSIGLGERKKATADTVKQVRYERKSRKRDHGH
jgi:hypothetical protein